MEIVIGKASPVGPPPKKGAGAGDFIEARMLHVRPPRRRRGNAPTGAKDRRGNLKSLDPVGSRVMVLLVPDGFRIPQDIDSGNYRVFIRFAPRKK